MIAFATATTTVGNPTLNISIFVAFVVATLAIVIFSRIGSGPSNAMHKRFDEAEQEYQDAHL